MVWFRAIWWVTEQKNLASALGLKRIVGLRSYRTAWTWLHKLHRAMVRPSRYQLSSIVEVDETFIRGEKPGKRGRPAASKVLVGITVEDKEDEAMARIRLRILSDTSANSLSAFIQDSGMRGSAIRTNDWPGYHRLASTGYPHVVINKNELKLAHVALSLLQGRLLGTHQGAVGPSI